MKTSISLSELRQLVRSILQEDTYQPKYQVSDPTSSNEDKAAKAPPGQWWNQNTQRYEKIPDGKQAGTAADTASKNAQDQAGHSAAADANLKAAEAHGSAAAVAKERGDTDALAHHQGEQTRFHDAHWKHKQESEKAAASSPAPAPTSAPQPKPAASNPYAPSPGVK